LAEFIRGSVDGRRWRMITDQRPDAISISKNSDSGARTLV
jgi:hypothetical protein